MSLNVEQFMRIVSWLVVFASLSVLAWQGLGPLAGDFRLPAMDATEAVGSVIERGQGGAVDVELAAAGGDEEFDHVFRGSESRTTADFEIAAPWLLDWRVTSTGGFDMAVDVSLQAAGTGVHQGNVLKTKNAGNGVRLFDAGGKFYFRVNSSFSNWTLRVKALTPEEAATYKPVGSED